MGFIERLKLCLRILRASPSNYLTYAENELPKPEGDEMQTLMNSQLKEMLLVFSTHGHSGFSAGYAISALKKLLNFEPLSPLTGSDDEWEPCSMQREVMQNKRCSRVFKEKGEAYDIRGKVFVEPNGCCFTSIDSRVPVVFPYTPKTEYVNVD